MMMLYQELKAKFLMKRIVKKEPNSEINKTSITNVSTFFKKMNC